jgi:hypothetical protein
MALGTCNFVCLDDCDLTAIIRCAKRRIVFIAPGLSENVARALAQTWRELGPAGVEVVLDLDPEVCRLGYGEFEAVQILHLIASDLGTNVKHQSGLRIGLLVTEESTVFFSPTPLLIEAGGKRSAKSNGVSFDLPLLNSSVLGGDGETMSTQGLNLDPKLINESQIEETKQSLAADPPMAFDVAQKVRVFNARFEFVEFELKGLAINRRKVAIPSDLVGLARDPKAQKLLHASFQLVGDDEDISGIRVTKLKQFIADKFLINLRGYGTVVLRTEKKKFESAVRTLERYVSRFQKRAAQRLEAAIGENQRVLAAALMPSVEINPPTRWKKFLGPSPTNAAISRMLGSDIRRAFGSVDGLISQMKVNKLFKGVTYELLCDEEFHRVALEAIPSLAELHDEYQAAPGQSLERAQRTLAPPG